MTDHDDIVQRLDTMAGDLEIHIAEGHAVYVHRHEIETKFAQLIDTLTEYTDAARVDRESIKRDLGEVIWQNNKLVDIVLGEHGPPDIDGHTVRSGGLQQLVYDYTEGRTGLKVALPWGKIILALIASVGSIVVAIVQSAG